MSKKIKIHSTKKTEKKSKGKSSMKSKKTRRRKLHISPYIPEAGIKLAKLKGKEVISKLGEEIVRKVVISVFKGENIRSLTEEMTRKRLSLSNAAMLITLIKSTKNIDKLLNRFVNIIKSELATKISVERKLYLNWMLGLTGKSIQNVTRKNAEALNEYLRIYDNALKDVNSTCSTDFGELEGKIKIGDDEIQLNWTFINLLFASIGSQTLTIRGAEKSMYGKIFEKLIIGSLLTILGFKFVNSKTEKTNNVFWLSERENKRESDATLLFKPGMAARFDIGFIGTGNTEISLDKVTRFEKEIEKNDKKYYNSTIIIVDKIGEKSRIVELAKDIDGRIIQMSMAYWIKDICIILKERFGFEHKILKMSDAQIARYIETEINKIDLGKFLESDNGKPKNKFKEITESVDTNIIEKMTDDDVYPV